MSTFWGLIKLSIFMLLLGLILTPIFGLLPGGFGGGHSDEEFHYQEESILMVH